MATPQTYTVALPAFEGPLELLVDLIEKRELEVTELSISQVTGDYLVAIAALEKAQDEDLKWFLEIGTKLVAYKTRAIRRDALEDELDTSEDLAAQIARYQAWRKLANKLGKSFGKPLPVRHLPRLPAKSNHLRFSNLTAQNLRSAWYQLFSQTPVIKRVHRVSVSRRDLERTMQKLVRHLGSRREVVGALDGSSRHSLTVSLLAMLELVKQDLVELIYERDGIYVQNI
jgi:segregation and condensation protein A